MNTKIVLPSADAVMSFVNESEASNDTVLVSKEGYKFQIDGSSLLGMMNVVGSKLQVFYNGHSPKMLGLLDMYRCI